MFDKVYYLDVPDEIQNDRLKHETRENPMGTTDYQRQNAIEWGHDLKRKAQDLGIEFIDAIKSPEEISEQLNASK